MSFLLDTVVLSELRKAKPSRKLVQWIKAQKAESLFISVVSIGEIERGIERARKSDVVFAASALTEMNPRLLSKSDPASAHRFVRWARNF